MTRYKITLTRTNDRDLYSQGLQINGRHYLISEDNNIGMAARKSVFRALRDHIEGIYNRTRRFPHKAMLEIITS